MSKIITCSGMIGAGKSTFITQYARYLKETYGADVKTYLEPVEKNELLTLMYEDPSRWTYTSQVRFLVDKLNTLTRASEETGIVLVERDYREQKIFIDAQYAAGSVTKLEYESYMELYQTCSRFIPETTDYHINLPFETCLYRMQERGRSCESLGSTEYYRILYLMYEAEYQNHPETCLITDSLDIDAYRKLDPYTFKGVYA